MRHVEELFEWALKLVNIFETSYARQDVIDLPSNTRTPCLVGIIRITRSHNDEKCLSQRIQNTVC